MKFQLFEITRASNAMVMVAEGEHNTLGDLMNRLVNRPPVKGETRPAHALYQGRRCISSTY